MRLLAESERDLDRLFGDIIEAPQRPSNEISTSTLSNPTSNSLGGFTKPVSDTNTKPVFTQPVGGMLSLESPVQPQPTIQPQVTTQAQTPIQSQMTGNYTGGGYAGGQGSSYMPTEYYESLALEAERAKNQYSSFFGEELEAGDIGSTATADNPFQSSSFIEEKQDVASSEEYQNALSTYTQGLIDAGVPEHIATSQAQEQLATSYGLPEAIRESEHVWYQLKDGEYVKQDTTPEVSDVAKLTAGVLLTLGTAGLAGALAPTIGSATGLSGAALQGASNAIVNGTVTALRGGNAGDILTSSVLSGVSGYVSGLSKELASIDSQLGDAFTSGDMSNVYALTEEATKLQTALDVATNTDNALQFAELVDNGGDVVQSAMTVFGDQIADFIDLDGTVGEGLKAIVGEDISNVLMEDSAFTNLLLDQASGRNLGEAIADRYGSQVAEAISDESENGYAFAKGSINAIAEYGRTGEAPKALFNGLRDYFNEGGDAKAVEDFLKNLVPELNIDFESDTDFGWIEDGLRELGREFDDSVLQPVKNYIEELVPDVDLGIDADLGFIEDAVKEGAGVIQDEILTPIEDNVLKPAEDLAKEGAEVIQDEILTPIEDNILKPIEDVIDTTGDAIGDAVEYVEEEIAEPTEDAIKEFIESIDFNEFDFDVNVSELPEYDFGIDLNAPDIPDMPDLSGVDLDYEFDFKDGTKGKLTDEQIVKLLLNKFSMQDFTKPADFRNKLL